MGKEIDIGVSQVSRKVKAGWAGMNNISRKIKAGWIGDASGVARQFYQLPTITFTYTSTNPDYTSGTITFTGEDNCQQLRTWIIGTIGDGSSSSTYRLQTGTLSGYGYGRATSLFYSCRSLSSLDVSNFDTSNVTNMQHMFGYCINLTSLDVSNFDTSSVTNMGFMFYRCNNLTNIDLSNFDTSNVTDMSYMFYGCSSLTSLDFSSFDTSNVTNMYGMFSSCSGLTSIDLSSFDTSNVTDVGFMFYNCTNLTTIYCENTWTGASGVSSAEMFTNDRSLVGAISYNSSKVTIDYANPDTGYFTYDYLCFTANTAGSTVSTTVTGTLTTTPTLEYSTDRITWNTFTIGSTTVTLTNAGDKMYLRGNNSSFSESYNKFIKFTMTGSISASGNIMGLLDKTCQSVTIPNAYCFYGLFGGCMSLTTAPKLPATTLAGACYAGMFGSTGLTTLPKLPATALTTTCYANMFANCSSIKLSETKTGEYTTEYTIPSSGTGTSGVNSLANMFSNTGGTFKGTPTINTTYYASNTVV